MNCSNCGKELAEGIKFCPECGTQVPKNKFCTSCGTKLEPSAKFCPECGAKVGAVPAKSAVKEAKIEIDYDNLDSMSLDELIALEEKTHDAKVQNQLGVENMLSMNYEEAEKWFIKSSENGNDDAIMDLGSYYYTGDMGDKDVKKAIYWFEKGFEKGHSGCADWLCDLYMNGEDVEKNLEKAAEYARKGNPSKLVDIGIKYLEEIHDSSKAFSSFKEALSHDSKDGSANFWMAQCYSSGYGVEKDKAKALEFYIKSAEAGDKHGAFEAGDYYFCGWGTEEDFNEAIKWYKVAADQGLPEAYHGLGLCYQQLEKDKDALKWFKKGADADFEDSIFEVGLSYWFGQGTKDDYKKSFECFNRLGEEYARAPYYLGMAYLEGQGVKKDYDEAVRLFKLGMERDDDSSCKEQLEELGEL